jgi:hypothetical protein
VRETLAGFSTRQSDARATSSDLTGRIGMVGEGAWHDPPHPQSKSRASFGAEIATLAGFSDVAADMPWSTPARLASPSQRIPTASKPNNEPSNGS